MDASFSAKKMVVALRLALLAPRLHRCLCSGPSSKAAARGAANAPVQGAFGSHTSRGSGQSLMGSRSRGVRDTDLASLAAGEHAVDDTLEAGDVLMEVLAEDHRQHRTVEWQGEGPAGGEEGGEGEARRIEGPRMRRVAHRRYLSHPGAGPGTIFERAAEGSKVRLRSAMESAHEYKQPESVRRQRQHDKNSRARQREHDVIENKIQEAMLAGAFDNLAGRGQPLRREENVFEAMAGETAAHKVLKNAGMSPGWVEQGKAIKEGLLDARATLAHSWVRCVGGWVDVDEASEALPSDRSAAAAAAGIAATTATATATTAQHAAGDGARELAGVKAIGASAGEGGGSDGGATRDPDEAAAAAAAVAAAGPMAREWEEALQRFDVRVLELNRQIGSYNLQVPSSCVHLHRLQPERERTRALQEGPRREAYANRDRRRAGSGGRGAARGGAVPYGGVAQAEVELPGLMASLSAVLSASFSR